MSFKKQTTFVLALLLTSLCSAKEASAPRPLDFKLSGFSEVVLSVSNLEQYRDFFRTIGGYEIISETKLDSDINTLWQLPKRAPINEVLLKNPGTESGFIRLVKIQDLKQRQIRSNTQSWDTGGIFDINMRVLDMEKKFDQLQALGWQSVSEPVQFEFGPFVVKEWIVRGPDGVTFALIERIRPELEGWPHLKEFSRVFNSTQTVKDIKTSRRFYQEVLGFKTYIKHKGSSKEAAPNVLGLPFNMSTQVDRSIDILHPEGLNEGSVEILQFHGATGRDVSTFAEAPNLGILTLRFPVKGLVAFEKHLQKHNVAIRNQVSNISLAPYGKVNILVVETPDGTLLEFYESVIHSD